MSTSTKKRSGKRSPKRTVSKLSGADVMRMMSEGTEIDNAIAQGMRDALIFHMKMGNPVAVMENGKVVLRDAGELLAEDDAARKSAPPARHVKRRRTAAGR